MDEPSGAHDPYAVLRNPDYRWFIVSMGLVTLGLQMQGLVVGWQVYRRTGDPLALGLVGLSEALPFLAVALFGGHVADRLNRLRLCMVSTLSLAACSALLVLFTMRSMSGPMAKAVVPMYGIIFLTGIVRAFYRPANVALGTDLLPKALYANGSTWRVSVFHGGMVIGPAIGGLVYGWRGPVAAHSLVMLLLLAFGQKGFLSFDIVLKLLGLFFSLLLKDPLFSDKEFLIFFLQALFLLL